MVCKTKKAVVRANWNDAFHWNNRKMAAGNAPSVFFEEFANRSLRKKAQMGPVEDATVAISEPAEQNHQSHRQIDRVRYCHNELAAGRQQPSRILKNQRWVAQML